MDYHQRNSIIARNEDKALNEYLDRRDTMSMDNCSRCGEVYDTDVQMETDDVGNIICDRCFEELRLEEEQKEEEIRQYNLRKSGVRRKR